MMPSAKWMENRKIRIWLRDKQWDLAYWLPRWLVESAVVRVIYMTAIHREDVSSASQHLLDRWRPGRTVREYMFLRLAVQSKFDEQRCVCSGRRMWCNTCRGYVCFTPRCVLFHFASIDGQGTVRCEHFMTQPSVDPAPFDSHTFDAKDWAAEYVRIVKLNPDIAVDHDTMLGWFANAIMAGYDYAKREER